MNIKILAYLYISPLTICMAYAQSPQSNFDKFKTQTVVLDLNNPALLKSIKMPEVGDASLIYFHDNGAFKHPLDAGRRGGVHFNATRAHTLNNWDFYGSFDVKSYNEKDVAITAMADPFRDNPYQLADSLSGEWKKQKYSLGVKIAAPAVLKGKLIPGLGINYEVLTGARQKDPRPLDNSLQLKLTPGLMYKMNKNSFLGINGTYQSYREDLSVELLNFRLVYNVYKLLGVGEYELGSPYQLSSNTISRRFNGDQFGGDVQYGYKINRFNLLASIGYNYNKESATDGSATSPRNAGLHTFNEYGGTVALDWSGKKLFNQIVLNWKQRNIDNHEFHQVQNSATSQYETVYTSIFNTALKTRSSLSYLLNKTKEEDKLTWTLKAGAGFTGLDNRYANPKSLQIVDKGDASLSFAKYCNLKNAATFSFGINTMYECIIKDKIEYTNKDYSTNYVAQNILYPIQQFLSTPSWNNQIDVQYTFGHFARSRNQLYIKGTGYLNTAMEGSNYVYKGSTRRGFQVSIGLYN